MVALQVVHPSAKDRSFGGASQILPIFVGDLLKVRNDRNAFLSSRRLGVTCPAFDYFSLYVPLAVVAILPVKALQFADCQPCEAGGGNCCLRP